MTVFNGKANMPQKPPQEITERYPPSFDTTISDIYFYREEIAANTAYVPHSCPWGQLNVVEQGVMEMIIDEHPFLSPTQYAIWIPPETEHASFSRQKVSYRALFLSPDLSAKLPDRPCMLHLSKVFKSILEDFAERKQDHVKTLEDYRLATVLMDQLLREEPMVTYLPYSDDSLLKPILTQLQKDPSDKRTLAEWATQIYSNERTLIRRFYRCLGISFSDWRQRLRFLKSIEMLGQGMKVNLIALELGYSNPSAFITMFRRLSGMTPDQYRRQTKRHK